MRSVGMENMGIALMIYHGLVNTVKSMDDRIGILEFVINQLKIDKKQMEKK